MWALLVLVGTALLLARAPAAVQSHVFVHSSSRLPGQPVRERVLWSIARTTTRTAARTTLPSYVVVTPWPSAYGCLSCIGATLHIPLATLERLNPLPDFNVVYPGQRITVSGSGSAPPTGPPGPPAPPAPPPTPSGGSVQTLIEQAFGGYAGQALAVARCESGFDTYAVGRQGEEGVFQFMWATWLETPYRGYSRFNAWANVQAARWLFARDGDTWREWTCGTLLGFNG